MNLTRSQDELEARLTRVAAEAGYACSDPRELCAQLLREVRCTSCERTFMRYQVRPAMQTPHGYLYQCGPCADKETAR